MGWEAETLAAAQFLTSGAAPCLHLPWPLYHLHPCPAPVSENRRVLPTPSPNLRCSSCPEVGGREKQAAGTLKFLISISTKGRENLRSRTGSAAGSHRDGGTPGPAGSEPGCFASPPSASLPFQRERIIQSCDPKSWVCPAAKRLGSLRRSPGVIRQLQGGIHPVRLLAGSVLVAVWPLVTACLSSGSESPGQGPRDDAAPRSALTRASRASLPLPQLRAPIGVAPRRPGPPSALATRLSTRGAGKAIVTRPACVPQGPGRSAPVLG